MKIATTLVTLALKPVWCRPAVLAGLAIIGGIIFAYHNSLSGPFLFDDEPAIVGNDSIRHLWPLGGALNPPTDATGAVGRPMVNLSLAINYALGGLEVRGYHALNLVLHLLSALTLWGILRRTLRLPLLAVCDRTDVELLAGCITLLWATHPLLTESVTFVVQRTEVLGGLFYLLTLYSFIRSSPCAAGVVWQVLTVLACLLGVASKEIVATAPLLVLLYDRTFLAGTFREAWRRRRFLYLALAATWLPLVWLMMRTPQRGGTVGFGLGVGSWESLLTQSRALVLYLKLSVWPHPLVVDYGTEVVKQIQQVWVHGLIIVGLLLTTLYALWRRPVLGFVGASFFVILAPSSSFVPLVTQTIAEHRMYLPLISVVLLFVLGIYSWLGRWSLISCLLLAGVFCALTLQRNEVYQDKASLWADTVAKCPGNFRAHNNLGMVLSDRQQMAEAIWHYREALRIKPDYADAHNNLGAALVATNRLDEAIRHYEQALLIKPDHFSVHANLAEALRNSPGRAAEAVGHYQAALRIMPGNSEINFGLAQAWSILPGHETEAVAHYEAALGTKPNYVDAHVNLGCLLLKISGRRSEGITHFEQALKIDPACALAHYNLAFVLAGQPEHQADAIAHYESALGANPGFVSAHLNLGNLLLDIPGRRIDAIAHYEAALRIEPSCMLAHYDLAVALADIPNRRPEVLAHCQAALLINPGFRPAQDLEIRLREMRQ